MVRKFYLAVYCNTHDTVLLILRFLPEYGRRNVSPSVSPQSPHIHGPILGFSKGLEASFGSIQGVGGLFWAHFGLLQGARSLFWWIRKPFWASTGGLEPCFGSIQGVRRPVLNNRDNISLSILINLQGDHSTIVNVWYARLWSWDRMV